MANPILTALHFHNEEAAFAHVEAALWPEGPVCPHCGNCDQEKIGRLTGKTNRIGLRKCYACRDTFTVRQGTIFEDSHLALHLWLQVIHLMSASKKGISTRQIQRMLNCSMKTAWHLAHRIRAAMDDGGLGSLGGEGKTVEADETFIGGKEKNKHRDKRVGRSMGTNSKETVLSLVERSGRVRSMHVSSVTAASVGAVLKANVDPRSKLYSDDAGQYRKMGKDFDHDFVSHRADEYVRGDVHTNTVEGYFSILKRGLIGVYHNVSAHHLHRYLSEFDFRYSNREALKIDDSARAAKALQGFKGKRLTYRTTVRA